MEALRIYRRLVYWDWVHEMKRKDTIPSMVLFSVVVLFVFSRAFDPASLSAERAQAGILWVTFLLGGAIGIERAFLGRRGDRVLEGLLLAPVGRAAIYYAKMTSTLLYVVVMEAVIVAAFCLLYNVDLSLRQIAWLSATVIAASIGFVAAGLPLSAMTRAIRGGDVLLRILLFALLIPILWVAVEGTRQVLEGNGVSPYVVSSIVAMDAIYIAVGQLLFDPLMRDYDGG